MKGVTVLLVFLIALTAAVFAAKTSRGWIRISETPGPKELVEFTFALKQQNVEKLEEEVLEISNPRSPRYSQWLTVEEILAIVAPPKEVPEKIIAWIESECSEDEIAKLENLADAVRVSASVACAERLFQAKMAVYRHVSGHRSVKVHKHTPLKLNPTIADSVDFVSGINRLPITRKSKSVSVPNDPMYNYNYVIPATARQLYNIPAGSKTTNSKSNQAAIEFYPEGAPFLSDMSAFATSAGELFTNISKIVGPWNPGNNGESILDVEYLTTIGANAYTWYITINGWQYEFALTLFNTPNPPFVNSVSYGWPEEDSCDPVTTANCTGLTNQQYVVRSNAELAKVAGLGLSVLVASQDEGAPSEANEGCELDNTHPLWPIYPASSPWVTAVSGTTLVQSNALNNGPSICNQGYTCGSGIAGLEHPCMPNETYYQWTTGGGFSRYASMPSWQSNAVKQYLGSKALIPPAQWFNQNGRGYPDISALGSRILTIQSGQVSVTAGTSAATPIIAAIITLLNDARFNAGKKQLGFLNPILYEMAQNRPSTFHVIDSGNNRGTIGEVCKYGYGCWHGWSPVTGLGTPNYGQILSYIKTLP